MLFFFFLMPSINDRNVFAVGQNKPPVAAPNGPFQPTGPFPPGPVASNQGPQLGQQTGTPPRPPANVNGFPSQQARMPTTSPVGYPPVPPAVGQLGQTPLGVPTQRLPNRFPPPPPPSSTQQPTGPLVNGPGVMNARPPVASSLPPSIRPAQMPGGLPSSFPGTPPFQGQGAASPGGEPAQPPARPLPPTGNVGQSVSSPPFGAGTQGLAGDGVPSR